MAKTSVNVRDRKRRKLVAKYSAKRKELKANGDWEGLDKLPRNSYIIFPLKVTFTPIGIPSLSLKFEIEVLAFVATAF